MTTITTSTLPTIDMDQLKSIVEADNTTMGILNHQAATGSTASQLEMEKTLIQQSGIVQVMDTTGFLDAMWNAYVSLSGNEHLTAADREAFSWATATAFQRGYMACHGSNNEFASLALPNWIN